MLGGGPNMARRAAEGPERGETSMTYAEASMLERLLDEGGRVKEEVGRSDVSLIRLGEAG